MPPLLRRALRWLPAAAQATLIFILSAQPDLHLADEADLDFVLHKLGHLGVYGVLAALIAWALDLPGVVRSRLWTAGVVLCLAYGASDELHQSLVQGRHPSPADVVIDTIGALVGLAAYAFLTRNRPSRMPV